MRVYVWLFHAGVEDGPAIRSIVTTKERRFEEWPHLAVPGVDGPDMSKLDKLLRPKRPKGSTKLGGTILDRSKLTAEPFTVVSQLAPEFTSAIAGLDDPAAEALGEAWSKSTNDLEQAHAVSLVRQIRDFAQRASAAGLPLLELVRM